MATFDPAVRIAGVILNKAGSARHAAEAVGAVEDLDVPVLGVLHRDDGIVAPSRHLGLVPAAERRRRRRRRWTGWPTRSPEHVDLGRSSTLARTAPDLDGEPWDPAAVLGAAARTPADDAPVVAVAGGRAFTFRYAETEELLRAAGLPDGRLRPAHRRRAARGTAGALPRRRVPRGARRRPGRERTRCSPRVRPPSHGGVPDGRRVRRACCTCAAPSTATPMVGALDGRRPR